MGEYKIYREFDDQDLQQYLPTEERRFMPGDGDFTAIGKHFASIFIEKYGFKSNGKILDVGCSIGRNAMPLTQYINDKGSYDGFDCVKDGVDHCNEFITSKNKNFTFKHLDIYNGVYNPSGSIQPSELVFPYKDNTFDFVFLISVFTHMKKNDVEHYLDEIRRVLKKGGTAFISYFLMNPDIDARIRQGSSDRSFGFDHGDFLVSDDNYYEGVISYQEEYLKKLYKEKKLNIKEIQYGWWSGPQEYLSYQDVIIATK